ncbi:MAG: ABC transporter ATP-binding protein [Myxococcota bacterium]
MSSPVLELRGASKAFASIPVLQGVDLCVYEGETVAILGGSGTGKSVMLKAMIGLLRLDSGVLRFRGRDVTRLSEREWATLRRHFGMVFQGAALFDSMSVHDNVAYPMREHSSLAAGEIPERVGERLSWVGLEGVESKLPAELSGGMRKRVGIARAIALDPEVMLYDEPTTGLDPANARRIGELVRDLQTRLRVTSVVVTHDLDLCFGVADRVGLLAEGRLVIVDTPERFRASHEPLVREFLGGVAS